MMGPADIRGQAQARPSQQPTRKEIASEIDRLTRDLQEQRQAYKRRSEASRPSSAASVATSASSTAVGSTSAANSSVSAAPAPLPPPLPSPCGADGAALAAAAGRGDVEGCRRLFAQACAQGASAAVAPALRAATLGGHVDALRALLEAGADPSQQSSGSAKASALHVAAEQGHGKMCMLLLKAGADPMASDVHGVTPRDLASCSEAVWPLFASVGCTRAGKEERVLKGLIRRASDALAQELVPAQGQAAALAAGAGSSAAGGGLLRDFSRPGSAYVATARHPPRPGSALHSARAAPAGVHVGAAAASAVAAATAAAPGGAAESRASTPLSRPGMTPRVAVGTPRSRPSTSQPIDILADGDCRATAATGLPVAPVLRAGNGGLPMGPDVGALLRTCGLRALGL